MPGQLGKPDVLARQVLACEYAQPAGALLDRPYECAESGFDFAAAGQIDGAAEIVWA